MSVELRAHLKESAALLTDTLLTGNKGYWRPWSEEQILVPKCIFYISIESMDVLIDDLCNDI